ncbi:MAG TPA: c-type cytochrome, partial [Candidatus Limnocylindria bacterium]|nr:c-type cytochrome [Candidatus Limnocylindria bacterium]
DQTSLRIEALHRLQGTDAAASPAVQQALSKVLDQIRGEPEFVELIRDFDVVSRLGEIEQLALEKYATPPGVQALQLLLVKGRLDGLKGALAKAQPDPTPLVEALGNTGDNRAAGLLTPLVNDPARPVLLRRTAVRAAAKSQAGAKQLLAMTAEGKLPDDVRLVASSELNSARWATIKAEAKKLLPPPAAKGDASLPSIGELAKMTGDPVKGANFFRRQDIGCINCHQVNGEGVDFGPKLSEIGTKLGKDALYEAILDPSSGIAFGFEAWSLTLKNGDEAFGLIASETEDEVVMKAQGGVLTRYKKSDIDKREKQAQSIMPVGLQANLTTQEFADLVEYLTTLKKR